MAKFEGRVPDFLGIGTHKSGTSWLARVLRKHDATYLPPEKELHYFDRKGRDSLIKRIQKKKWRRDVRRALHKWNSWYSIYFLGRRSHDWYKSLFYLAKEEQLVGEITPSYLQLEMQWIQEIHSLNPNLKLFAILRNPIDRAWAHFRFQAAKKGTENPTEAEMIDFMTSGRCFERGLYSQQLGNWLNVFPREQIKVLFYDELKANPNEVAQDLFRFLGIDDAPPETLPEKVNPAPPQQMPPEVQRKVVEAYSDELKALNQLLQHGVTQKWVGEVENN